MEKYKESDAGTVKQVKAEAVVTVQLAEEAELTVKMKAVKQADRVKVDHLR